jgi:hypothetical protein
MQATFRLNEKNCFKARRRDKLNKQGGKSFSGEKQKKIKSNKPILLEQGAGA